MAQRLSNSAKVQSFCSLYNIFVIFTSTCQDTFTSYISNFVSFIKTFFYLFIIDLSTKPFKLLLHACLSREAGWVSIPTFIIPESSKGMTWLARRSFWIIEEGPVHLHLQASLARWKSYPDGVMTHRIAIPGVLDGKLHLGRSAMVKENQINNPSWDHGDSVQQEMLNLQRSTA